MKILICGTRGCMVDEAYHEMLDILDSEYDRIYLYDLIIIHGACPDSPDMFGDRLHDEIDEEIEVQSFPADWKRNGKTAGFIRNNEMICQNPDLTIAIWDGYSKGTEDMIVRSVRHGVDTRIIPCEKPE